MKFRNDTRLGKAGKAGNRVKGYLTKPGKAGNILTGVL